MPRHVHDFVSRRRADAMNRLYVVEATPSLTGARADHRRPLSPAEIEAFARAVAAGVGAIPPGPAADPFAAAVIGDLSAHRGSSLVVAGETQPAAVHALAHAINAALGNAGKTVRYTAPAAASPSGQVAALSELARDMAEGRVSTLAIVGGNPVFSAPADLEFGKAMEKVGLRIHLGLYNDETSRLSHWHVAEAHPLESWSDARAEDGTVTILQPLIAPLFSGRTAHELLAAFSAEPERSSHDILKDSWRGKLPGAGDEAGWQKALHDGLVEGSASPSKAVTLRAFALNPQPSTLDSSSLTLLFRPDPTIGDGSYANNGWLQELAKPLTKLTWENAALVAPATAQKLGVTTEDVVELTLGGRKVLAPVWVMPGQAEGCVTVHFGYGRTRGGRVANGAGFDAYALRASGALWSAPGLEVRKTLQRSALATTQHHHSMEGRDLVRAVTAEQYRAEPDVVAHMGEKPPGPHDTLYPQLPRGSYAWGMAIDLSTCVGCNACVIACQSENNIPVVGKEQVLRGRAMPWIRIDRYYSGGLENPETIHQPVTCMHCENAPCEVVCPVNATVHCDRGPQPDGLQPLRRHAVLLEQLPVQGAALQLLSLLGLHDRDPQDGDEPGGHGPQPRRDGEVQLLRAAHQPRSVRGGEGEPADPGRRDPHGLRAGLPGAGDHVRQRRRSREPGVARQGREARLRTAGRARHAPAHDLSRLALEPAARRWAAAGTEPEGGHGG